MTTTMAWWLQPMMKMSHMATTNPKMASTQLVDTATCPNMTPGTIILPATITSPPAPPYLQKLQHPASTTTMTTSSLLAPEVVAAAIQPGIIVNQQPQQLQVLALMTVLIIVMIHVPLRCSKKDKKHAIGHVSHKPGGLTLKLDNPGWQTYGSRYPQSLQSSLPLNTGRTSTGCHKLSQTKIMHHCKDKRNVTRTHLHVSIWQLE